MAVRESDTVTGKPLKKPEAKLAAPSPTSSALASILKFPRAPKLRAATMPEPKLTSQTAAAPESSSLTGKPERDGRAGNGKAAGRAPMVLTPSDCRSSSADKAV